MQKFIAVIIAIIVAVPALAQKNNKKQATGFELKDMRDSVSYSLAVVLAQNLKEQGMNDLNTEILTKTLGDILSGKLHDSIYKLPAEQCNGTIQQYMMKKQSAAGDENLKKGNEFLENNKKQPGVKVTASGLQYKVIKEGNGKKPTTADKVTVHYTGTLIDGRKFDSSKDRGEPITFDVTGVIAGWTEGLQLMNEGSIYMLYIPASLAYGPQQRGPLITPNSTLVFEVELIAVAAQ